MKQKSQQRMLDGKKLQLGSQIKITISRKITRCTVKSRDCDKPTILGYDIK
jgi:hypothetical protein